MESCLICGPSSKLIDKKCNQCNQKYDLQKIDLPDNISKFTQSVNNFFFTIEDTQSLNGFLDYTSQLRKNLNISYDVSKQVHNLFDIEIKKIQSFSNFSIKVQSEYTPHNIQKKIFQLSFSIHNISPKELYSFKINFSDEHEASTPNFIKPNQQIDLISDLNYSNFGQMILKDFSLTIKNQFEEQQRFNIETFKIIILKPKPVNLAENKNEEFQIEYLDLNLLPIIDLDDLNKSILSSNVKSQTPTYDNESKSNDNLDQPQPFYANEYSHSKSNLAQKNKKQDSSKYIKKSKLNIKKFLLFLFIPTTIIIGLFAHDYNKPCDALVFQDDYKCLTFGSCSQILDKFYSCKGTNSTCIWKWGKNMSVDEFTEFTDIKGGLIDSNSKYKVSGQNYSSRWIRAEWYYYNDDILMENKYGENIVVGPVGSSIDNEEFFADLSEQDILNDDSDGWAITSISYVEDACYSPKP